MLAAQPPAGDVDVLHDAPNLPDPSRKPNETHTADQSGWITRAVLTALAVHAAG
jgi:hypothetical protein